jgi:hypothetical protein
MPGAADKLLMIVDPETKEAYRKGEGPRDSGPVFFTTRDRLDEFARQEGIAAYEAYEVPGGVLARMKGKPHWLDGRKQ